MFVSTLDQSVFKLNLLNFVENSSVYTSHFEDQSVNVAEEINASYYLENHVKDISVLNGRIAVFLVSFRVVNIGATAI